MFFNNKLKPCRLVLYYLDPIHLVQGPPVVLIIPGVPDVQAYLIQDPELVVRVIYWVFKTAVKVYVPCYLDFHNASFDGKPVKDLA